MKTDLPGASPVDQPVGRPVPERTSDCGLTECQVKPMCERCAYQAGALLKPCPWCWTNGADLLDLWDHFDAGHVAYVHCTHCGADGPIRYSETSADAAIKLARNRWNASMAARGMTPNVALSGGPLGDDGASRP